MHIRYIILSSLGYHWIIASALCYAPDGSLSPGDGYMPCVTTLDVDSMCCVLNVTALELIGQSAANVDTCQPDGLCLNGAQSNLAGGQFSRNFCTDRTWKSPNCLNVCAGGNDGGTASTFSIMTHCADGSWCCGITNLTSCCNVGLGFQLAASIPPYASSAVPTKGSSTATTAPTSTGGTASTSASPTTITTSSISPTPSSSSPSLSTPPTSSPSSGAASASPTPSASTTTSPLGIGLGIALSAVLLAIIVFGLIFAYRRYCNQRHRRSRHDDKDQLAQKMTGARARAPNGFSRRPSWYHEELRMELEQPLEVHEVTAQREPAELHGWSARI